MTSFCRNKKSAPAQRRTRIVRLFHRNWCEMVINNRMMSNEKGMQLRVKLHPFLYAVNTVAFRHPLSWGCVLVYSFFLPICSDGESIGNEAAILAEIFRKKSGSHSTLFFKIYPFPLGVSMLTIWQDTAGFDFTWIFSCKPSTQAITSSSPCSESG